MTHRDLHREAQNTGNSVAPFVPGARYGYRLSVQRKLRPKLQAQSVCFWVMGGDIVLNILGNEIRQLSVWSLSEMMRVSENISSVMLRMSCGDIPSPSLSSTQLWIYRLYEWGSTRNPIDYISRFSS